MSGPVYHLNDDDDPRSFNSSFEFSQMPSALLWRAIVYYRDPTDTTSPHDGELVLVTADGTRYKRAEQRKIRG